jgi:MFS family permease
MILRLFPEGADRNRALGIWGALVGLAAAMGVIFGGLITEGPGWRWIFLTNVPVALGVCLASPRLLPESRSESTRRVFDVAGGVAITLGLVALVYAMVRAPDVGWSAPRTIVLFVVGGVLVTGFITIETRSSAPLLPLDLLRIATVSAANAVVFLANGAITATIFVMTLYMQQSLGYSAIKTGVAYLPFTIGILVFSTLAARLVTKCGVKLVLSVGLAVVAIGLAVFASASSTSSYGATLLPGFLLLAVGVGAAMVPLSIAAFAGVSDADFAAASGLFNTSQQVGGAFGVAVLSTVAYSHLHSAAASGRPAHSPLVLGEAYTDAFAAAIVLAVAALIVAAFVIRQREVSTWHCATPYRLKPITADSGAPS